MAAKILKYFLEILSDATFLSSIEYFDFKNRYVSIRRDFFNLCFNVASSNEKIYKPRRLGSILKQLFINRFLSVSSTNLKKYFDNKISNSYIDFLNIARYYSALLRDDQIDFHKFFRNYLNKRNFKFFEKKGYKYYLYTKSPEFNKSKSSNDDKQQQQQGDNSNNIDIVNTTKLVQDYQDLIESDDQESVTSSEMRDWLAEDETSRIEEESLYQQYSIHEPTISNQLSEQEAYEYYLDTGNAPPAIPSGYIDSSASIDQITYRDWDIFYANSEKTVSTNIDIINREVQNIIDNNQNNSDVFE